VEARQVEAGEAVTTVVEEVASSRVGISYVRETVWMPDLDKIAVRLFGLVERGAGP